MNKNMVTIGVLVLVLGAAFFLLRETAGTEEAMIEKGSASDTAMEADMVDDNTVVDTEDSEAMAEPEMGNKDTEMMDGDAVAMGSYESYSSEKLARAATGDVILFFNASWCPSCRGLNANIESNLSSIPEGVSILKVDYDTETALKQKYGVTYQHTLVQVDASGNMLKKWSGSPSLTRLLAEVE